MNRSLSHFQDAFAGALYDADAASPLLASLLAQPGFAVYRNNVVKACIDALQANFPSVERLVGSDWFRAAAAIYVRRQAPSDARLLYYGHDFPAFLDDFEPARELPYLANVARLDRLWTETHAAADEPGIDVVSLACLAPEALGRLTLPLRAAVRWQWFANQPTYTIWRCNREAIELPSELDWSGEGALLTRPEGAVQWRPLSAGGCVFLDACAASQTLDAAAQNALDAQPSLDFMQLLGDLIAAGAFAAIDIAPH
ncbi:DNA-binding domain-containing protein [Paraburkholderia bryophila]|uniref:HvfC/BufC N-terminal domain-containing protein n=1 Tax=Burkholderiaceae TaxID=119060 RepID=UPI000550C339|nr:DNA-binding domain-containing protein [Burkholderia sp. 9120]